MTITWQHTILTLLIALALHGGIALWLILPEPQRPAEPLAPTPLRVSLLATVAQTHTAPVAAPVQPKPTPAPIPKPIPETSPPAPTPKLAPAPRPVPKPVPQPEPSPEPAQVQEEIVQPAPEIPQSPPAEIPQERVNATVEPSLAPLSFAATAKYEQLLVAWLEKHKKYPKRAKRMRIEGEGRLRILIDRNGRLQSVALEQRTGNRLLDKAALAMAQRADPFPAMPDNDPRQALEFIVPVVFALR